MNRIVCIVLLGIAAATQSVATCAATEQVADTPANDTSSPRLRAAAELLHFMNIDAQVQSSVAAMVATMTQSNPRLLPFRDVITQWASSFMTEKNFGPSVAAIYAEAFTEPELHDLLTFYKSPTGQKALAVMPTLTRQGMQLGVELAKEHLPELQQMIRTRAAQLKAQSDAAEPASPQTAPQNAPQAAPARR